MPLPRALAEANKRFTNHLTRPVAGRAPGFAVIHHVGRRSGRHYETPVNLFEHDGTYTFALTYGGGEWVENVLAAGGCEIRTRGHLVALTDPEVRRDPELEGIPAPARWILSAIDVDQVLTMRRAEATAEG